MKTIWIVEGETGEHADYCNWVVCAYKEEWMAAEHADQARARAHELFCLYARRYSSIPVRANQYDAKMRIDYTGTTYRCYPLELRDALP